MRPIIATITLVGLCVVNPSARAAGKARIQLKSLKAGARKELAKTTGYQDGFHLKIIVPRVAQRANGLKRSARERFLWGNLPAIWFKAVPIIKSTSPASTLDLANLLQKKEVTVRALTKKRIGKKAKRYEVTVGSN